MTQESPNSTQYCDVLDAQHCNSFAGMSEGDIETSIYRMLSACDDIPILEAQVAAILSSPGFDTYSYTLVGLEHKRLPQPMRLLSSLPDELVELYDEKDYGCCDVALDYAFNNSRDIFYSDLQAGLRSLPFESEAQMVNQEIHKLYRSFGYHDLYLLPLHRQGRKTVLSVACKDTDTESLAEKVVATECPRPSICNGGR